MDAKRSLNCLSLEHFERGCAFSSKCRVCGHQCSNKHAFALLEYFNGMNLAAAEKVDPVSRPVPAPRTNNQQSGSQDFTCCKLNSAENSVVLLILLHR